MTVRGGAGHPHRARCPSACSTLAVARPTTRRASWPAYGVADRRRCTATEMDIEWCRVGGELCDPAGPPDHLRAPTAIPGTTPARGDFLWTNTNVGEAIPDVMTPATWSMVQVFLSDAMATASIPPYVGYGRIGGRIYLNVSVMAALSGRRGQRAELPLPDRGGLRAAAGRRGDPAGPGRRRCTTLASVVPVAAARAVGGAARRPQPGRLPGRPSRSSAPGGGPRSPRSTTAGPGQPVARRLIEPEFHRISRMLSAATRRSGASFVTTRRRLQEPGRATRRPTRSPPVSAAGAGQLASLGLLDGLDQLAAGEIDRETFNLTYGHRGPHEFEISTAAAGRGPGLDRPPAGRPARPTASAIGELLDRQEQARDKAWRTLEHDHPLQARLLHWQIAQLGRDRPRPRARPQRGDPLLLGAAGLRAPGR